MREGEARGGEGGREGEGRREARGGEGGREREGGRQERRLGGRMECVRS